MEEFDQDGVRTDAVDDRTPASPEPVEGLSVLEEGAGQVAEPPAVEPDAGAPIEPEAAPEVPGVEPEAEGAEPVEAEPATVQESMSFDDIVASAAASSTPAVAQEPAGDVEEGGAAPASEDLDDMVEALKEGAAAKTAADETAEGEEAVPETVDDETIAGEALAEDEQLEELEEEYSGPALVRNGLATKLPAWIYAGVWVVFAGVMTYLLWPVADKSFVNQPYYAYMVGGGLVLAVAGPVTALLTWVFARMGTTSSERIGLARAIWMRCMLATVFGVAVWWIALIALDMHRTGKLG